MQTNSGQPTAGMIERQRKDIEIRTRLLREMAFEALWGKTEYALCSGAKRLRDMNGIEVSMVAGAMDTLRIMNAEARALMRVSQRVGPDRILKKVMNKEEFVEFCLAPSA